MKLNMRIDYRTCTILALALLLVATGCRRKVAPAVEAAHEAHKEIEAVAVTGETAVDKAVQEVSSIAKADTAIADKAAAALNRGLDYLLAQQQTNGVWSNAEHPALTALPLWALTMAGRDSEADRQAITAAAAYVAGCAQEDGGLYVTVPGRRGGALGTYNTAICMTALHAVGNPDFVRLIQNARKYVSETQLLGDDVYRGGFGYERGTERPYADLNNTAWALAAMRVTQDVEESRPAGEERVDVDWDAALAFVTKMQLSGDDVSADDAGGFLYKPEDPNKAEAPAGSAGRPHLRSFGSITYSGLLSLIYARVERSDPRVVSAVDYARRHWTLDENPGMGQQGLYYYYTIMARSLAATGLAELPPLEEGGNPIAWRDELITKLADTISDEGSWVNSNNRFWESDPVLATAYAVIALEYATGQGR